MGLIIIGFVVLIGVYCFVAQGPGEITDGAEKISQYVDNSDVYIASVFGIKNPLLSGAWYFGTFIVTGYAFIVAQGKRFHSYKESNMAAPLFSHPVHLRLIHDHRRRISQYRPYR